MINAHDVDAFEPDKPAQRPRATRRGAGSSQGRHASLSTDPLRAYHNDSRQAQARLLALSLLANGRMNACEVAVLCDDGGLERLGLTQAEFFRVLYDFCADVERMPALGGGYVISSEQVQDLLDEITDPTLRERTLDIMYEVMRSDGRLDDGELALLMATLRAWDESSRFPGHAGSN